MKENDVVISLFLFSMMSCLVLFSFLTAHYIGGFFLMGIITLTGVFIGVVCCLFSNYICKNLGVVV